MASADEPRGEALYEAITGAAVARKEQRCANRCSHCWHDRVQRCICHRAPPRSLRTTVNVKVLVLMHSKEYLNPGDDAKLLLAMLPAERSALYVPRLPSHTAPFPINHRSQVPLRELEVEREREGEAAERLQIVDHLLERAHL